MSEKLIFPIGFNLEEGVKEASKEWKSTYQKQLQKAIDDKPLKVKIDFESKGIDTKEFKQWMVLSREAEKLERERIKNAKEWQKVADQQAMAETRRANATNESNARIERANRKAEASEQRKRTAVERTNAAYKTQSGYLQRLFQRMVAYASVAQAFSFVRNVRDVTAEFEFQRVALGSIIGDLNEANAMFEQIKAAAVKSPFQIKELVTYTKQLAAYGFEQEQLFDTTMQLADISAGLGVGMERLALFMGQVRATGYLRASEVRQATEAGIPLVEQLAKKMSELRGETVSAAEVMGMISERAISFGMVKEVFDDMTSAGGMFYKMQEKQAETLAGQWSNLQDAISIMYDEIGNTESVNNAMKGMIGLVKSLAENWRTIATVVNSVGLQFAAFQAYNIFIRKIAVDTTKVAQAEERLLVAQNARAAAEQRGARVTAFFARSTERAAHATLAAANATTKWGKAWNSMKAFLMGNWIGLLLSALAMIGTYLYSSYKEAKRLNEELEKIGTEGALQADQSVRNFERLTKTIRESAVSSKEYGDAMAELKRSYSDLLPSREEDIDALIRTEQGYRSVIDAIREKITLQVKEQQISQATSHFGSEISKANEGIKKVLKEYGLSVIEISQVIDKIQEKTREGFFDNKWVTEQISDVVDIINSIVPNAVKYYDISRYFKDVSPLHRDFFSNLIDATSALEDTMVEIEQTTDESLRGLEGYAEGWKKVKDSLKDIRPDDATLKANTFAYDEAVLAKQVDSLRKYLQGELDKKQVAYNIGDVFDFDAIKNAVPKEMLKLVEAVQTQYEKLVPTGIDQLIRDKFQDIAKEMGVSMDLFKNYFKASDKSTKDWAKGIESSIESLQLKLSDLNKLQDQSEAGWAKGERTWRDYSEEIKNTTDTMSGLQLMLEFFKDIFSPKGGGKTTNPRIALLNEELSTVEKIYKEYQELRKFMSEDDARARIAKMFEDVNLTMLSQALSPTEMRAQLQKALDEAKKMGDKKQILELEYKLGKFDADEEQRKLEKSLKDLSDKISRTKTAKEFFDRILGMNGDRELSATLTMSVYGTTGDDLKSALVKQVEQAFKGVDISGAIDYNTMTINYQKLAEIYAKNQDKILDANKSMAESIVKDGQKTSASQIEQWAKELEAVKTYADKRVDIARQTQQRISEIEASTLPEDEKQRLQEQYRKKEEKDLAKLEYQSFKDSPMYVAMFDNLDSASTAMLNNMRAKLMELKEAWGDLDMPTELKEMQSRLNEIDKQLASRNPFKTLANAYKGYQELREQGSRKEAEQDLIDKTARHAKEVAILNENIKEATRYQQAYDDAVAEYGKDSVQARTAEAQLYIANSVVETQKEFVNTTENGVEASQELVNKWKELDDVVGGAWEKADMLIQAIIELGRNLADAFGGFGSDADAEYFDTMMDSFSNLSSGITSIGKGITMGDPIAIINGIGSAISGLAGLFTAGKVRKANKEIERQQDLLDKLEKSHEKLEKQIEKTFGTDYLDNYNDRLANLYAQQEAYLKQAEAERSKGKKEDEEKTQGYLDSASDVAEQIADMQKEVSERFLGTDLASTARDFAQSWIDAYKEFGSTTDAMKEKFHDMIQNMVVESIAGKMMQELLRPVFEDIEKYTKDGNLDEREIADIADMSIGLIDAMDEGMTGIVERLRAAGYDIRQSTSGLTGISKDIASASEESILGLAAGINTQNFYISQVPPKLDTIIALLQGGGVQVGGGVNMQDLITIQNQHLSHLPNIAQNTAETVARCERAANACERMADQLDRVIKPRGTQATHTVNTSL